MLASQFMEGAAPRAFGVQTSSEPLRPFGRYRTNRVHVGTKSPTCHGEVESPKDETQICCQIISRPPAGSKKPISKFQLSISYFSTTSATSAFSAVKREQIRPDVHRD